MNFTIAVLIGILIPPNVIVYAAVFVFLAIAYIFVYLKTKRHFILVLCLGFFTGIFAASMAQEADDRPLYPYVEQEIPAVVEVASNPVVTENYTKFQAIVRSANGVDMQEKLIMYVYGDSNIKANQRIAFSAIKIKLPKNMRNFGGFDYRRYLTGKNIFFTANAQSKNILEIQDYPMNFRRAAVKVNAQICTRIENSFDAQTAAVLKGIFLGDKTDIPDDVIRHFRDSGLSHVMAVSGLHLTMLVMLIGLVLKKVPRWLRNLIVVLTVIGFSFIVGLPFSVIRAGFMLIFLILANSFYQENDSLTNLSAIALILLLSNANVIYDTGFVMSFTATLGIVCIFPWLRKLFAPSIPASIADCISITVAAQIGTLPFMILSFGQFSFMAIISNLIICVVLPLIFLFGITALILPAQPLIYIGKLCVWVLSKWAQFCADIPGQLLYIPQNVFVLVGLFGFTVFCLTAAAFQNKKVLAWCLTISVGFSAFGCVYAILPPANTEITFINVDQADAALIQTEKGDAFLIDTGTEYAGENEVVEYLLRNGVYKLSGIFISHFHDDHCGGLIPVLETIDVEHVYIPDTKDVGINQYTLLQYAEKNDISVHTLSKGDTVQFSDMVVSVLHPESGEQADETNVSSMAVRLENKDVIAVFPGDLENDSVLENCKADILKVSHHGSKNGSTQEFLNKCTPEIAVMCLGENNVYGFPKQETLDKLEQFTDKIYRTDLNGTVQVICDDRNYFVNTLR